MIKRTYAQVKKSKLLDKVVVATEDKRIEDIVSVKIFQSS